MKNRARIVSGLAALAALFLAPIAEASLTRATSPALEAPPLTLASPASEPSEFSLFEGNELAAAAAEAERAPSFHPLAAVSLLSKDGAEGPLVSVDELIYPKTRYRVFGLLGTPILGELRGVSLELHWGCAGFSCGLASGTVGWLSQDPMGDVDSPNLYGFVGARPHEKTDPLGLEGVGESLKRKWGEFSNWWSGLGSKAREKGEEAVDTNLPPPPDPTKDLYGAREALKEEGYEGQYFREKAARAGACVRHGAVRAGGLTAQGTVEAGKFYAEGKALEFGFGAIGSLTEAAAARRARLAESSLRGRAFEEAVRAALNEEKNREKVRGAFRGGVGNAIPDLVPRSSVTEIKDVLDLSLERQLQIEVSAAKGKSVPFNLIVSPRNQSISAPLQRAISETGGTIQVFDPATGLFRPWS